MSRKYSSNYFPNYQCGECPNWFGMDELLDNSEKISNIDDFIQKHCGDCKLFKKDIKVVNEKYSLYRNCFIQEVDKEVKDDGHPFMYKVVNRDKIFYDILEACDYIDTLIEEK